MHMYCPVGIVGRPYYMRDALDGLRKQENKNEQIGKLPVGIEERV